MSCYSIVEYSTPEEAQRAIQTLSDKPLDGRPVFVREVRGIDRTVAIRGKTDNAHSCRTARHKSGSVRLQHLFCAVVVVVALLAQDAEAMVPPFEVVILVELRPHLPTAVQRTELAVQRSFTSLT